MANPNRAAANMTTTPVYEAGVRSVSFVQVTRDWFEVNEVRTAEGMTYVVGNVERDAAGDWAFTPTATGRTRDWVTAWSDTRVGAVRNAGPTT